MSKITDEKLQYNINRKETKISSMPAGKIEIEMNIFQVKKYCYLIKGK